MAATELPTITPAVELAVAYSAWSSPWLDGTSYVDRQVLTATTARLLLAAPLRTSVDAMVIVAGSWSREAGNAADAKATPGSPEWMAILDATPHESCTLTSDGHSAGIRWCEHSDEEAGSWVTYERWSAAGRVAHGFVCSECRGILQTG